MACFNVPGVMLRGRTSAHTARPLVDLRLFRVRSFASASALTFTGGLTLYGGMFLLPLCFQQVRHESVIGAGPLLVPQGVGALPARATGGLADRVGPRPVAVAELLLSTAGTLPFAAGAALLLPAPAPGDEPEPARVAAAEPRS